MQKEQSEENVLCTNCEKSVALSSVHAAEGKDKKTIYICHECRGAINAVFEEETRNPKMARALIFGVVGGVVGGALWYTVVALTGYEIGYVAIAVGFVVGWMVHVGAGRKRGRPLQLMALAITAVSIYLAKYFIFVRVVKEILAEDYGEEAANYVVSVPLFDTDFLSTFFSSVPGVIILVVALIAAFVVPRPRRI